MSNRTMVKLYRTRRGIDFQTISRQRKSPLLCVPMERLAELEKKSEVVVSDFHYGCVRLQRNVLAAELTAELLWLEADKNDRHRLTGWREQVILPYEAVKAFAGLDFSQNGPKQMRILATEECTPRFVFQDTERLHECLAHRIVRRRLVRFLRDHFHWAGCEEVCFYNAETPYSFIYQALSRRYGAVGGALLLCGQENMETAYYWNVTKNYEEY